MARKNILESIRGKSSEEINSIIKIEVVIFCHNSIGFDKFVMLIKSFIAIKGWHIQFNIISIETLKKAKINPTKYRDIIVRVARYYAQFVTLYPTTQDDIISRTEQKL